MAEAPWHAFYQSDLQSLYALVAVPTAFLVYALARPVRSTDPQARFLTLWSIAFALETILDPIATGPLARGLGLSDAAHQAVMLGFVLLGDWRVLLLVFALAYRPERRGRAFAHSAALSLAVPMLAFLGDSGLRSLWPELPGQVLWLVYELGFVALALALRRRIGRGLADAAKDAERRLLRALLGYAASYYALWASADALILAGFDAGWGLRILPNQLYYAFTVPFVFFIRFGSRNNEPFSSPSKPSSRG
jgi:hypothetical protein